MRLKGWGQGVNKDQPPWELAPGVWSDCANMRFRAGRAQRVGGISSAVTPSITPYFILPYSSGATSYLVYMGLTKAYAHDGTSETEITRKTFPTVQTISSASAASGTVTIQTSGNHLLATGDIIATVNFKYKISGAGTRINFNKANATITVTDATHFTYPISDTSSGSATTIGTYSIVYTAGGSTSNFTGAVDDKLTGGNYNGVAYVNSPKDGFFYWDQSVTGVLHPFADTIITKADAARSFKNRILFFAPTSAGTKYLHRLWWSASADPGSVPTSATADPTNDAGFQDLVSDGAMVDGAEWGDIFYAYKHDKRFSVREIGGQFVLDLELVPGNNRDDGLLAQNCIANTPVGQVFISNSLDIRIHTGGPSKSIAEGRILRWFQSQVDSTYKNRCFLIEYHTVNEVWVCFPASGQTTCTKALIWNYLDDTWGIRDLPSITAGQFGFYPTAISSTAAILVSTATPKIGLVDSGYTDFGSTVTSTLERTGMDFDDPAFKSLSKSMWLWDASTNFTASIYHGYAQTQDATPTYTSALTYTHNTSRWVNGFSGSGPWLALKCSMSPNDTPSLVTIEADVKKQGGY